MDQKMISFKIMMDEKIPAIETLQNESEPTLKRDSSLTISVNKLNSHENVTWRHDKDLDGQVRHLKNTTLLLRKAIFLMKRCSV